VISGFFKVLQARCDRRRLRRRSVKRRAAFCRAGLEPLEARLVLDSALVFNEIMYNPAGSSEQLEWVELANQLALDLDISGWKLSGGIDYEFPPSTVVKAGGFVVVAADPAALAAESGFGAALGPYVGRLSNEGERIELRNNSVRLMDAVDYDDEGEWPVSPDGGGDALAKLHPSDSSAEASSWVAGKIRSGTPGAANIPSLKSGASLVLLVDPSTGTLTLKNVSGTDVDLTGYTIRSAGNALRPQQNAWTSLADQNLDGGNWFEANPTTAALSELNLLGSTLFSPQFSISLGAAFLPSAPRDLLFEYATASGTVRQGDVVYGSLDSHALTLAFNEIPAASDVSFWVEMVNLGSTAIQLLGHSIGTSDQALPVYVFAEQVLAPGGILVVSESQLGFRAASGDKLFLYGPELATVLDGRRVTGRLRGRSTDHDGRWLFPSQPTPGAVNQFALQRDVVINEIMYHAFPELGSPGIPASYEQTPLVRWESFWRYNQQGTDLGADWAQTRYVAGGPWSEGPGVLGFETSPLREPIRTSLANPVSNVPFVITYYFQTTFAFDGAVADFDELWLRHLIDDGAIFFLNGQEAARFNMPGDAISHDTFAASGIDNAVPSGNVLLDKTLLRLGENTLSVEVHQHAATSSDVVMGAELLLAKQLVPAVPPTPFSGSDEEWFELYNRGDAAMDLGGWGVRGGIHFDFAQGTQLQPGEFLVIARDSAALAAKYPDIPIVGNFTGRLGNDGDVIRLTDAFGNPADEVRYYAGGNWPQYAAGGGSSLELRDPWADNRRAEAWGASLEGHKSTWQTVTYRGVAGSPPGTNFPSGFNDFILGLLQAGELLLDDIRVTAAPDSAPVSLIQNGTFSTNPPSGLVLEVQTAIGEATLKNFSQAPITIDGYTISSAWGSLLPQDRQWISLADAGTDSGNWSEARPTAFALSELNLHAGTVVAAGGSLNLGTPFQVGAAQDLMFEYSSVGSGVVAGQVLYDLLGLAPRLDTWRPLGNHKARVVVDPDDPTNHVLHLAASGPTEHMHNKLETTLAGNLPVTAGTVYEITFRAKWIAGSNQVNTRLYFNHVPRTTLLEVPRNHGTPGKPNTMLVPNLGPTFTGLRHEPLVPAADEPVTVSIAAADPHGVESLRLWWAVDDGPLASTAMVEQSSGVFSASIPGQSAGKVVQFYIEGRDGSGAVSTFPALGAASRALYRVQRGPMGEQSTQQLRIIMSPADHARMREPWNVTSNELFGATVIYNDQQVFYDVGVHIQGSGHGRGIPRAGFSLRFHPDQLFRGVHETLTIDRSARPQTLGAGTEELVYNHVANRAGGMSSRYDDVAYIEAPDPTHTGMAQLKLARYTDHYLDSAFDSGANGELYEYELIYYTTRADAQGRKLWDQPGPVAGVEIAYFGEDKEAYRHNFLLRNRRTRDDYSRLVALGQAFSQSGQALADAAESLMDIDLWAREFALLSLAGSGDTYNFGLPHNVWLYVRPTDGRIVPLPWDQDLAFSQSTGMSIFGQGSRLQSILALPQYRRLYLGHVHDLVQTFFSTSYLAPWLAHYSAVTGREVAATLTGYINSRVNSINSELTALAPPVPFEITSPDATIAAAVATVDGMGWINVRHIRLAGSDEPLTVTWLDQSRWRVTVPIAFGPNPLVFEALDFQGVVVGSDTILLTSSVSERPLSDFLRISEIMYHPADPSSAERQADLTDADLFEFIELVNTSATENLHLQGVRFDQGISYDFSASAVTVLAPGEHVVLVKNRNAFLTRYPGREVVIGGEYSGNLSNGGERLRLIDSLGVVLLDFTYDDVPPWRVEADGNGPSLVIVDATGAAAEWGQPLAWRASCETHGSPGAVDRLFGDLDGDYVVGPTDLNVLQRNLGRSLGVERQDGDLNGDGRIDRRDVVFLSRRFGQTCGSGWEQAVPSVSAAMVVDLPAAMQDVPVVSRQKIQRRAVRFADAVVDRILRHDARGTDDGPTPIDVRPSAARRPVVAVAPQPSRSRSSLQALDWHWARSFRSRPRGHRLPLEFDNEDRRDTIENGGYGD
jgi:hypothetical protein